MALWLKNILMNISMLYISEHSHQEDDGCSDVFDLGDSFLGSALLSNFPSSPLNETLFLGDDLVGDLNSLRSFSLLLASLLVFFSPSSSSLALLLVALFFTVDALAFGVDVRGVPLPAVPFLVLLLDLAVLVARGVFTGLGVVKFLLVPTFDRPGEAPRVGVLLRALDRSLPVFLDLESRLGVAFDERDGERERLVEAALLAIRSWES